jgi:serum/glucocorticoid-regulated kinase 2
MKEISKVKTYLDGNIESLISEFNILKRLSHPFISNLYFSFQDKEYIFLILDYLSGGTLRSYYHIIFTENQTKFLISNIILSLEYIHKSSIIHRDLKPENLLFDDQGYLHLIDFGISKIYNSNEKILDISGTPGYISPEIILGYPQNFVSDFFGLGIITYELIFGKRPFNGKNKDDIADNILNKKINLDKNNMKKNYSIDAADFINRLLRKKNNQRLGSKGIDEIKNHKWFEDVDWISLEYKNIDTNELGILQIIKKERNENIEDINIKNKIEKYNTILNKINKENYFIDFYFNYNDKKNEKENENISNLDKDFD